MRNREYGNLAAAAAVPAALSPRNANPGPSEADVLPGPGAKRKLPRVEAIDFARGLAVSLMILSHGVKGLLRFDQFPAWGLVPIHLITKFSSSLFFLVFGVALAVVHLPHVGTARWPEKRMRLLVRGVRIFFWYKVLTIVEMFALYKPAEIIDTLLYRAFPVYVEILGYYAIALLWMPFALPAWKKAHLSLKLAAPFVVGVGAYVLAQRFGFFGSESLQAILVEHEKHYTWGQLTRLPLVMVGLLLGEFYLWNREKGRSAVWPVMVSAGLACALFAAFLVVKKAGIGEELVRIALNEGKHPPELDFSLFSVGGAFLLLAGALLGGNFLARALKPITIIGQDALQAFVFHIFVIFVFYRYLFGYWHQISYEHALALTGLLIGMTALWIKTVSWVKARS